MEKVLPVKIEFNVTKKDRVTWTVEAPMLIFSSPEYLIRPAKKIA
jgi:hypothetical protein